MTEKIEMKVKDQSFQCKIQFINKVYMEKFNKYLYYQWIIKHVISQPTQSANRVQRCKFQCVVTNHNLRFIAITFIVTTYKDMIQENFVDFLELIQNYQQI